MFCHLNYKVDKEYLLKYWWDNYRKAKWYRFDPPRLAWLGLFQYDEKVEEIIDDLGLSDMNIKPRFRYQFPNCTISPHLDEDKMVKINCNLMPENPIIDLDGKPFEYENALIDVGTTVHGVLSVPYQRLTLQLGIRESWKDIIDVLEPVIDIERTEKVNPGYKDYVPGIKSKDKKYEEGLYTKAIGTQKTDYYKFTAAQLMTIYDESSEQTQEEFVRDLFLKRRQTQVGAARKY